MAYRTIRGDWMDDGFQCDLAPRSLDIEIMDNGTFRDADQLMSALLTVQPDGTITGWGAGVSFSPDPGELKRVGLA